MKHFLVTIILVGYMAIAPACFFDGNHTGPIVPIAHGAGYESGMTDVPDAAAVCLFSGPVCTTTTGSDSQAGLSHHSDMYASFFAFLQTHGFLALAIIFFSLLFTIAQEFTFFRVPVRISSYIKKRREILSIHKSRFLRWLSLSINSPAYAFVM
jgi:hypothetical protein